MHSYMQRHWFDDEAIACATERAAVLRSLRKEK